jgi:hypothetical protein
MIFDNPKKWVKWLSMVEWWYNTNYHTTIKTTPFQAMYGYSPQSIPMDTPPKGSNQAATKLLIDRQSAMRNLKEQLVKAQTRMKKYADMKRSERSFNVVEWVYLKLQPYRQISVQGNENDHKLKQKFCGPFEVLTRTGTLAYHLNLPLRSLIHPVFHVSQLKKRVGPTIEVLAQLPLLNSNGQVKIQPRGILGRRLVNRKGSPASELLVQWDNLAKEHATREDYSALKAQFPDFCLEDKTSMESGEC